ncbi:MAG: transposase [Deltaproteobacteria bacterium]|nr:transposase [Deltaproteobacteria bacterium]
MNTARQQDINTLFSSEQACVFYLFKKRWPEGFICPFCGRKQKEMAPAYTVVCRYCRKQTSITAHTLMHGTKKSLIAWMQLSWQFCFRKRGLSAREVQRIMVLASYQTAWRWLQKIREGAAQAESVPCRGNVLFDCASLPTPHTSEQPDPCIAIALEQNHGNSTGSRVLFAVLASRSTDAVTAAANRLIFRNATLQLRDQQWIDTGGLTEQYSYKLASREQLQQGQLLIQETTDWLNITYRGAVDTRYLQSYLAEFSFHHNTAFWPDPMAVFDHLLGGLISSTDNPPLPLEKGSTRGRLL